MYKLILLIAISSFSLASFAQDDEGDDKKKKKCEFFARLTLGLNFSGIGGNSDSYSGGLAGGSGGIGTDLLCIDARFSVAGELLYSMQGSKYEEYQYEPGNGGSNGDKATLRMNYLVLPLTARYQSNMGVFAEAGVQPGLLLSAKDKSNGSSANAKEAFNNFDMGLVIGAGYKVPESKLSFGLRFVPGLTNINKSSGPYKVTDHNRNASFRLSYSL